MSLYPLLFDQIVKLKIWGKEIWSLSGYGNDQSIVNNGFLQGNTLEEVLEVYMDELVGGKVYDRFGNNFPLLFKIIDAQDDLSIQVHPNDEQAKEWGQGGKTEMWYVSKSSDEASIIYGFSRNTNPSEIRSLIDKHKLKDILQVVRVKKGDVAYIPAGTVHTLCKGTQVVEVQQSSDITFRLYDYDRVGADGKTRPLHIEEALSVLNYKASYQPLVEYDERQTNTLLVNDPHFSIRKLTITKPLDRDYVRYDSFVVLMCLNGEMRIKSEDNEDVIVRRGQTCLIPASLSAIRLIPSTEQCELLEVAVP